MHGCISRWAVLLLGSILTAAPSGCTCDFELPCLPVHGASAAVGDLDGRPVYRGTADVYRPGPLEVRRLRLDRCERGAPRALAIHAPAEDARYPVVVLDHGFLLANAYYEQLLDHLASHGFVVVAPQMYEAGTMPLFKPSFEEEARRLVEVLAWLPDNLSAIAGVHADTDRVGLAGHSRGGSIVWRVLQADPSAALAVAGIDPVRGENVFPDPSDVPPEPYDFNRPALILGAGLASAGAFPCAPVGRNYEVFYAGTSGPAWQVVAPDMGHLDMLDDDLSDCQITCFVCAWGADRDGARRLVAGQLTALFRLVLQGDAAAEALLLDAESAPIPVVISAR